MWVRVVDREAREVRLANPTLVIYVNGKAKQRERDPVSERSVLDFTIDDSRKHLSL